MKAGGSIKHKTLTNVGRSSAVNTQARSLALLVYFAFMEINTCVFVVTVVKLCHSEQKREATQLQYVPVGRAVVAIADVKAKCRRTQHIRTKPPTLSPLCSASLFDLTKAQ